jgi:DNA-binding MarR family transcriptional regulator
MKSSGIVPLPCFCSTLRRSVRALSQRYDEALRPHGLRAAQFTLLQALSLTGEVTQRKLGEILAIDSTTLTRTLDTLRRSGWVTRQRGEDRREWRLQLSPEGREQLRRATPAWEKTQRKLADQLGDKLWHEFFRQADRITAVALKPGEMS